MTLAEEEALLFPLPSSPTLARLPVPTDRRARRIEPPLATRCRNLDATCARRVLQCPKLRWLSRLGIGKNRDAMKPGHGFDQEESRVSNSELEHRRQSREPIHHVLVSPANAQCQAFIISPAYNLQGRW
jgi:hypothetical protein